jgi:nucleoside-diphosphate-sugar epimerase
MRSMFGVRMEPTWGSMPSRAWDTDVWYADITKIRAYGWTPRYSLADGFDRFNTWLAAHPAVRDRYQAALLEALAGART